MLILYHHNISVCAQKVRIALVEKDLPWEGVHVDLMQGEHLNPEFLKINPRGLVPVLVHDGDPIYEFDHNPRISGGCLPTSPVATHRPESSGTDAYVGEVA